MDAIDNLRYEIYESIIEGDKKILRKRRGSCVWKNKIQKRYIDFFRCRWCAKYNELKSVTL